MATVSSVIKHFPSAEEGFTTQLASSISSGATTVPLNSVSGYANGEVVAFVVDPTDASKKQAFTGTVDTAGVQITNVVWTEGSNQTHTAGATVVDYATATHISMVSKGILVEHNQDGTHSDITADSITADTATFDSITVSGTATSQGWTALGDVPDTVTYNGNRNYDLVFNGVDHTGTLSPGMKLQLARTVAAPDQCTDLEASSSQYYSKSSPSGMAFTDDFTCSAWIKVESYGQMAIVSRYNGTSGWVFRLDSTGAVTLVGYNAGATNFRYTTSYASIPLNKWVHVAGFLDMSGYTYTSDSGATNSYLMIDGAVVAGFMGQGGTNPTSLAQLGNLEIGGQNGGTTPFDGKIAQVAIYSARVTPATIKASMNQALSGSETNLISAYSFDNSINDLNTSNANNLTAQNSAVATNADSPFANAVTAGSLEYAEVNSVSFSTNTTVNVRVPDTCMIPTSGGVSSVFYSTQSNPYGLPYFSKILAKQLITSQSGFSSSAAIVAGSSTTIYAPANSRLKVTFNVPSCSSSAQAGLNLAIYNSATVTGTSVVSQNLFMTTLSTTNSLQTIFYYDNASAGNVSFCGSYSASSGTGSVAGGAAAFITFTVELV